MKNIITLLLSFFIATTLSAEENKNISESESINEITIYVQGKVIDKTTGESLVGAKIHLKGTNYKAYTDFEGNFSFENVKPGEYTIESNYISYKKNTIEKQKIDLLSNQFNVKLEPVQ